MKKERLDVLLVKRNFVDSREKAKRLIMAGHVFSNTERLDKPGMKVDEMIPLTVKETMKYVGRGGYKLEKALHEFPVDISGKIVVDIGASTGGFTDCALQNGAKIVYAIDVGYNQLDWKLRSDDRVVVMERTNFRYVTQDDFQKGLPQLATIDVSFISLRLILPVLQTVLQKDSDVIMLIKPQFEAEKGQVGKKGVVRDKQIHHDVLLRMKGFIEQSGFCLHDYTYSPITGGEGNVEFLAYATWQSDRHCDQRVTEEAITKVVDEAHRALK